MVFGVFDMLPMLVPGAPKADITILCAISYLFSEHKNLP
jgi:hypothetical protein